ncbi:hypothetical protein QBC41DRAFT_309349 [Cercophora samala]|uniref:Uncharacterized protein n=1 Tax=Cercophora samala TaxID=330535 RepID=A0AA40DF05_9PEZI|nr:hypothetical protein QBC41DRAFT_309349 [Cercophora samala]
MLECCQWLFFFPACCPGYWAWFFGACRFSMHPARDKGRYHGSTRWQAGSDWVEGWSTMQVGRFCTLQDAVHRVTCLFFALAVMRLVHREEFDES